MVYVLIFIVLFTCSEVYAVTAHIVEKIWQRIMIMDRNLSLHCQWTLINNSFKAIINGKLRILHIKGFAYKAQTFTESTINVLLAPQVLLQLFCAR